MPAKKTKEDFHKQLPEYEIIGELKNFRKKTKIKHLICGYTWECVPSTMVRSTRPVRCPHCSKNAWNEDFYKKFLEGIDIEIAGTYTSMHASTEHRCKKCGSTWKTKPNNIVYNSTRCPECNRRSMLRSTEWFKERLHELYGDEYTVLGEYTTYDKPVLVRHSCGNAYMTTPNNILGSKNRHGRRCPKCYGDKLKLNEEFQDSLDEKFPGEYKLIGDYTGSKKEVTVEHLKCGHTFTRIANHILTNKTRCPLCYDKSKPETEIYNAIRDALPENVEIKRNYKLKNGREIDIYIPSKNIGIEFDGLYWHSERIVGKKYQLEKTKEANSSGIRLIHVFEDEFISKRDIVISKLKSILKVNNSLEKVYARKCTVKGISVKEKNEFLEKNHIQGADNANLSLGLFNGDKLVSVMTFTKNRLGIGHSEKGIYELSRFANDINYAVIGSFGKLLKNFKDRKLTNKIISYADLRWSSRTDNIYVKNNFKEGNVSEPDYWYFKSVTRYHRFGFRKSILKKKFPATYSDSLTEYEIMKKNGFERIWDCGTIRYEMNF